MNGALTLFYKLSLGQGNEQESSVLRLETQSQQGEDDTREEGLEGLNDLEPAAGQGAALAPTVEDSYGKGLNREWD